MHPLRAGIIVGALCIVAPIAIASDSGVSASAGTTGIGVHVQREISPEFSVRLGANAYNRRYNGGRRFTDYDIDLQFRTIDFLADWHPLGNGLRFTGGLIINNSKVNAIERPSVEGSFTFGGRTYRVSDIGEVRGKVDFRRIDPYLGIGWGNDPASGERGWNFTSDLGVIFVGRARLALASTGCDFGRSLLGQAICNRLEDDLTAENARIEQDLRKYRFYPVVRLGLSYRF